jgi:hypothetical protein
MRNKNWPVSAFSTISFVNYWIYYISSYHTIYYIKYTGSLKSMDTGKYFQNGLAELVEIWHTVRSV